MTSQNGVVNTKHDINIHKSDRLIKAPQRLLLGRYVNRVQLDNTNDLADSNARYKKELEFTQMFINQRFNSNKQKLFKNQTVYLSALYKIFYQN